MDNASTTVPVKNPDLPPKAKHWTIREEESEISHRKLLGKGGFGEVHEVRAFLRRVLTLQLSNTETGNVNFCTL
jgi:hypothetical protein